MADEFNLRETWEMYYDEPETVRAVLPIVFGAGARGEQSIRSANTFDARNHAAV